MLKIFVFTYGEVNGGVHKQLGIFKLTFNYNKLKLKIKIARSYGKQGLYNFRLRKLEFISSIVTNY